MRDKAQRDKPWIFRTYAGHSTARDSNALRRDTMAQEGGPSMIDFDAIATSRLIAPGCTSSGKL